MMSDMANGAEPGMTIECRQLVELAARAAENGVTEAMVGHKLVRMICAKAER